MSVQLLPLATAVRQHGATSETSPHSLNGQSRLQAGMAASLLESISVVAKHSNRCTCGLQQASSDELASDPSISCVNDVMHHKIKTYVKNQLCQPHYAGGPLQQYSAHCKIRKPAIAATVVATALHRQDQTACK